MKKILAAVLAAMVFAGCRTVTFNEPQAADEFLAVGTIKLEALNYSVHENVTINGTHTNDLYIEMQADRSDSPVTARAYGKDGIFIFPNLETGRYKILKIEYKYSDSASGAWSSIWFTPNIQFYVTNVPGTVHNIGFIDLYADKKLAKYRQQRLDSSLEDTKSAFRRQYPESGWNGYMWE